MECSSTDLRAIVAAAKFDQRLADIHEGRITLCPGEVYVNSKAKVRVRCEVDGHEFQSTPDNLVNRKRGCPACNAAKTKARNDLITAAFVGQTTSDGHVILEHVGYKQTPYQKNKGEIGSAIYRYRCAQCGNEKAVAAGGSLKKNGHTTHCGCLSQRDSAHRFTRKEVTTTAQLYVYTVRGGTAWKIGIAQDHEKRKTKSYEEFVWASIQMPRAECWAIEQIVHYQLTQLGLHIGEGELEECDVIFNDGEAGRSELFCVYDIEQIEMLVRKLCWELQFADWLEVLDKYIPFEDMSGRHLHRWDGHRVTTRQPSCDKHMGMVLPSLFSVV